jgi:SAM-dependent methyltransferase
VLELSAGTGIDSKLIAKRLNKNGELYCLDISQDMLKHAKLKLKNIKVPFELICGTAVSLPFKDDYFDSLFCFAGVGHFIDLKAALSEMARVVKPGGKVVFSEKNVPLWLRNTLYGKILINNNPMFADEVPLKFIPVEARKLCIRWINGNVHYVIDYSVGEGEPKGNFNLELPGIRGGSFYTRYFGQIEGVTKETKNLAIKAREILGISMHKWLDRIISKEAKKIIKKYNP